MSTDFKTFLLLLPILLASMAAHELAHGYAAFRLGDRTAQLLGRLSPNPLRHFDPLGTFMFVATFWILTPPYIFGWAKPIPVVPGNLRRPQRDMAIVAAAGPAVNFVLAILFAALIVHAQPSGLVDRALVYAFASNVILGLFNLLPIPPLDGSRIVGAFMDRSTYLRWMGLDQFGMIALIALFLLLPNVAQHALSGVYDPISSAIVRVVGG